MAQAAIDSGPRPVTVTVDSERILDTRTNLGLAGRFADATPRDLQVTGSVPVASGGDKSVVPADASSVLVNVTIVSPSHEGFLSLRAKDAAGAPTTSTVNFVPGAIEPNAATVDLKDGQIQIWVETASDSGSADVLIDVVGYTIDHNHDDRYYQKSEVDSTFAAKADMIWAVVRADGMIVRTNDPGTSAVQAGPGNFIFATSRDVSGCAYIATLGSGASGSGPNEGEITVRNEFSSVNNVYVQTNDSAGAPAFLDFHIAIHC